LIKKNLAAAYFLIYQRTTEAGTSTEASNIKRLQEVSGSGKENINNLYQEILANCCCPALILCLASSALTFCCARFT